MTPASEEAKRVNQSEEAVLVGGRNSVVDGKRNKNSEVIHRGRECCLPDSRQSLLCPRHKTHWL